MQQGLFPSGVDYRTLLGEIASEVQPFVGRGELPGHIPALAAVEPTRFGIALITAEGEEQGVGDFEVSFSIQSISKVFNLSLLMTLSGDGLWQFVGREPSGNAFDSLVQLEYERGIPRNPFINAGALVVTDQLQTLTGDAAGAVLRFLRNQSGNQSLAVDRRVANSEAADGHRNSALAHFLKSYGMIQNKVDHVLEQYFDLCAIAMSCLDLARASRFLVNQGFGPDGTRLMTRSQTKQINAVMLTCGTYDAAGEFAYRVGLPCKSGVGGGIIATIPNRLAMCVWSPGLDPRGNSLAGLEALDRFTTKTGLSIF